MKINKLCHFELRDGCIDNNIPIITSLVGDNTFKVFVKFGNIRIPLAILANIRNKFNNISVPLATLANIRNNMEL